MIAPGGES
jgi:hypothetical protein